MRRRARLTRYRLAPANAERLCREVMPVGGDDLPSEVFAWRDARGRWRRVVAEYPNGWRLSFGLSREGVPTRVAARIKLIGQSTTLGETP